MEAGGVREALFGWSLRHRTGEGVVAFETKRAGSLARHVLTWRGWRPRGLGLLRDG
jgi:hypothetical protein